jgi:hypothetical protein
LLRERRFAELRVQQGGAVADAGSYTVRPRRWAVARRAAAAGCRAIGMMPPARRSGAGERRLHHRRAAIRTPGGVSSWIDWLIRSQPATSFSMSRCITVRPGCARYRVPDNVTGFDILSAGFGAVRSSASAS